MELGESVSACGVRETEEETGIRCEITGLVGIYTNPNHVLHYTSNDEVRQEFSIVLTARVVAGKPTPSSETTSVEWVEPPKLDGYSMHRSMQIRVEHFAAGASQWPYLR
jgi:8-oxo-dGTP pyrophosphatase MutT (NUDIX family)